MQDAMNKYRPGMKKPEVTEWYIEYPPFAQDALKIIHSIDYAYMTELQANYRYEMVEVGPGKEYATLEKLKAFIARENAARMA